MKEGVVRARNMAIAKQAELSAERQRLQLGQITFIRRPMIDKLYSKAPRGSTKQDTYVRIWV